MFKEVMTEQEREEAARMLRGFSHMNDGAGLIVQPAIASRLKANGIEGPYTIQQNIPTE